MKNEESTVTRRKLVGWLGIVSVFAAVGGVFRPRGNKKPKTVKLLTQDGTLVEVDENLLASSGKTVSSKELQNWVSRK